MSPKILLAGVLFVAISSNIFSQQKSILKDTKVSMKFEETVRIKSDMGNLSKVGANNRWLRIDVSYVLPEKKESVDKLLWLDDMEIEYQVLMPSTYKGKSGFYVLFSGKVTYWAVPMDGKKHRATAFIPPQIINRYKAAGDKLRKDLIKSMYAKMTFYSKERKVLGYIFDGPKGSSELAINSIFKKASEPGAKVIRVEHSIYPRTKTPWAPLDFDFFDLVKEDSVK